MASVFLKAVGRGAGGHALVVLLTTFIELGSMVLMFSGSCYRTQKALGQDLGHMARYWAFCESLGQEKDRPKWD